jgi:hypothetical protein
MQTGNLAQRAMRLWVFSFLSEEKTVMFAAAVTRKVRFFQKLRGLRK